MVTQEAWIDRTGSTSSLDVYGFMSHEAIKGAQESDKIYCACGRIVNLDAAMVKLKQRLGKEIECARCRNHRIAEEIEDLERIFNDEIEEDAW